MTVAFLPEYTSPTHGTVPAGRIKELRGGAQVRVSTAPIEALASLSSGYAWVGISTAGVKWNMKPALGEILLVYPDKLEVMPLSAFAMEFTVVSKGIGPIHEHARVNH